MRANLHKMESSVPSISQFALRLVAKSKLKLHTSSRPGVAVSTTEIPSFRVRSAPLNTTDTRGMSDLWEIWAHRTPVPYRFQRGYYISKYNDFHSYILLVNP